jgi:uncharacterized iron-regulated membrane protein
VVATSNSSPTAEVIVGAIALALGVWMWSIRKTRIANRRAGRRRERLDARWMASSDYVAAYGSSVFLIIAGSLLLISGLARL